MYVTCIDFNDKNLKRIEIDDVVVVVVVVWGWLKLWGIGATRGQLPTIKKKTMQLSVQGSFEP